MAPRKHDDDSTSNNNGNNGGNDGGNDVSSSTTVSATSATDSIISAAAVTTTSSVESATATALFNTAVSTPVTSPSAGSVNATPSPSGQSSTSVKIIGGIAAALIGILIIFSVAIFYLKRRWKAKEQANARRTVLHDAKAQHDEEEGGGEGTAFIGDKKGHSREDSMASTRSKSSADDYLKSGRKRSTLGSYYTPGVATEEAYMMFGGSTADLNEEEEKPLTYQQRHLSESSTSSNRHSWGSMQGDPRSRRISLLDDDSRYPVVNSSTDELGRRQMRHSVSYPPGIVDPFSDATLTTSPPAVSPPATSSPKAPSRAFTTGDVANPGAKPAGARPLPPGAQTPASPEGRRVSLKGGVGVRQKSTPGSPGSPRSSPRAAWK